MRNWISHRELFDDESEPEDRGILLTEPDFVKLDDGSIIVTFSVTAEPKD